MAQRALSSFGDPAWMVVDSWDDAKIAATFGSHVATVEGAIRKMQPRGLGSSRARGHDLITDLWPWARVSLPRNIGAVLHER